MTFEELDSWYRLFQLKYRHVTRLSALDFFDYMVGRINEKAIVVHSITLKQMVDKDELEWRPSTEVTGAPLDAQVLPFKDGCRVYVCDRMPYDLSKQ